MFHLHSFYSTSCSLTKCFRLMCICIYVCCNVLCIYIYTHYSTLLSFTSTKLSKRQTCLQSCRYVNIQHLPHVVRVLHATFAQLPSTSQTKRSLTPSFSNKRVMNWIDSNNAGCSVVNLNSSVGRMDPIRSISCSWMDPPESAEPLHDLHQKPRNTHLLRFCVYQTLRFELTLWLGFFTCLVDQ